MQLLARMSTIFDRDDFILKRSIANEMCQYFRWRKKNPKFDTEIEADSKWRLIFESEKFEESWKLILHFMRFMM